MLQDTSPSSRGGSQTAKSLNYRSKAGELTALAQDGGELLSPPALIAEVRDDTKLAGCDPPCKDPISYAGKLASGWGRELQPHELPNEKRSEK